MLFLTLTLLLLPRPCCLLRVLRYTRSEKKDVARFRIVLKLGLALNIPVDDTELVNVGLLRIAGLVARHALVAHSIIISIFTFILSKPTKLLYYLIYLFIYFKI